MTTTIGPVDTGSACPLCDGAGGELVWRGDDYRVVLADEPGYPGFTRVIWNHHVAEMTDLGEADRVRLMQAVYRVESVQRSVLAPTKINLASLGNMVPHLHWHVIPRWADDPAYPDAVWAPPKRQATSATHDLAAYVETLRRAFPSTTG